MNSLTKTQRQNIKNLFNDIKTSINVSRSDIDFTSFRQQVKATLEDRTLTRGEFRSMQKDIKTMIREADISQEDAQTLLTDWKQIAVEAGVKKPPTLSQEQKQNVETLISDLQNSVDSPPDQELVDDLKTTLTEAFSDGALTQSELVAIATDTIEVVASVGITPEEARTIFYDLQNIANASLLPRTNDNLTGTDGDDILWGGLGNDGLTGAGANGGVGEVDWLIGGGGQDRFVLGDSQRAFYNDGQVLTAGLADFAAVLDFNANHDVIELHGSAANYQLAEVPSSMGISGTGIYQIEGLNTPELIGVVVGVTLADMSSGFSFV
ncbi:hypothetical protein VB711_15030 [Cronbergia sp. UHCC 0137]|uniref:hypothetical protein n=1 Tax=Cronbergia sp. UHCC 0137 TaxID=3110239 RepID=UPI002B209441|nr:hypothetical protein [Cronbergia sp. UHCC 0137]MEA5619141.1 hypothetical protein [Cronbergia sp. UHCC 0137]